MNAISKEEVAATTSQPVKSESKISFGAYATSAISIVALIGIALALAGYGVALAVETTFSVPHATIFKSNFDLVALSVWSLTSIVTEAIPALKKLFFSAKYLTSAALVVGLSVGIWITLLMLDKAIQKFWTNEYKTKLNSFKKKGIKKSFWLSTFLVALISGLTTLLTGPIIILFILTISVMLAIIPSVSMMAAQTQIQEYVIKPKQCMPTENREERIKKIGVKVSANPEKAANCVAVMDGDKLIAQGRVVFSTTENIVLYDPESGEVVRESITGRKVKVLSKLIPLNSTSSK